MAFPCGKCPACISKRRAQWAGRILLEATAHPRRCIFATLTYDREAPSLSIRDCQLWLKRLRKKAGPFRMFYCGEYGTVTERPHYHAVLFGLPECPAGPLVRVGNGFQCVCATCSDVRETWTFGHTTVSNLNARRAMYVAGYVTKKMTHRSDPRLYGREPEFARMSLRPGIGAIALAPVISTIYRIGRTIPPVIAVGKDKYPLGRYLRKKIASELGQGNEAHSQAWEGTRDYAAKSSQALQILRLYAKAVDKPVEKVWKEVLESTGLNLVIPDIPTIHRHTNSEV